MADILSPEEAKKKIAPFTPKPFTVQSIKSVGVLADMITESLKDVPEPHRPFLKQYATMIRCLENVLNNHIYNLESVLSGHCLSNMTPEIVEKCINELRGCVQVDCLPTEQLGGRKLEVTLSRRT
jgi:hypothetical protein